MNILRSLALGCLFIAGAASADSSDDIKMQALSTRGTDEATLRPGAQPTLAATRAQTDLPDAVAHDAPAAPEARKAPASVSGDALFELAARQIRRQRRALDACTAGAQQRNPAASGVVTLRFQIDNRKVTAVSVDGDTANDPALASCLVAAGRTLSFSLKAATFSWPVALAKSLTAAK